MAPKKKQQKMALVDFFAETPSSTNWADEMDTLPSAPTKKDPNAPRAGGYLDNMPDRAARPEYSGPPRDEIPIPSVPPFTAFIGNLTFEVEESEVRDFFGPGATTSVRLVKDLSGKPKGFGYAEFKTQQDLKDALDKNMTNMSGRTIRVSVADSQSKRPDGGPSAAETASEWRRSGPLPARDAPQARRAGSFADGPAGPGADVNRDLDWGSARGAKFAPAPPSSDFRRGDSFGAGAGPGAGPGGPRDRESTQFGSGMADGANQWRSNKPAAVAVERASPVIGSGQNSPGLAETEQTWTRGSKLRTPIETPPVSSPAEDKDREWRGSRAPSATASAEDSPKAPAAPLERRKLTLAPRSQATEASPSASKPSSSSIFGGGKPIDTSSREAEVEAKRQEERKKAQEERARKHKEEEDKIKAEADARTKAINDAREAVRLESLGPGAGAGAGAGAKKPQPPRQGSHGPGAGARQNSNSNGAGGARPNNSNGAGAGAGSARPNKGGRTNSNQAQKTEDGFEVATTRGSRRDNRDREDPAQSQSQSQSQTQAQAQAQAKKDAPVRKGFSFAAAAGLVDDAGNGDEGDKKDKDETEDVSQRLAEVKV